MSVWEQRSLLRLCMLGRWPLHHQQCLAPPGLLLAPMASAEAAAGQGFCARPEQQGGQGTGFPAVGPLGGEGGKVGLQGELWSSSCQAGFHLGKSRTIWSAGSGFS